MDHGSLWWWSAASFLLGSRSGLAGLRRILCSSFDGLHRSSCFFHPCFFCFPWTRHSMPFFPLLDGWMAPRENLLSFPLHQSPVRSTDRCEPLIFRLRHVVGVDRWFLWVQSEQNRRWSGEPLVSTVLKRQEETLDDVEGPPTRDTRPPPWLQRPTCLPPHGCADGDSGTRIRGKRAMRVLG